MAEITLTNVSKIYEDGFKAVKNVNLKINDHEFMVLVGPSGCGKSTTLRMIAGLEDINEGTIAINDKVVNNIAPKDRNLAMVFQNYALYPHMTVFENMAFGLKLRHFPKNEIEHRVKEAAATLGLEDYLSRYPKALSGGQRQRVAVGRAIVRKPEAFLFDEPLSNLDAKMRVQMRTEVNLLHKKLGTTMVYVTHDQVEAMTMGSRICVLKDGEVQQIDTPLAIYDSPANLFVAGFIGMPPMNFFDGTIECSESKITFVGKTFCFDLSALPNCAKLKDYCGKKVVFGVRPEDIGSPIAMTIANAPKICGKVTITEPMGAETYVYMESDAGEKIVSKVDPHMACAIGENIALPVNPTKVHVFDAESTLLIV